MADYSHWDKACCGRLVGHKEDCPEHPLLGSLAIERRTKGLVHNHGIDPSCRERIVDGKKVGECMADYSDAYGPWPKSGEDAYPSPPTKVDAPKQGNSLTDYEQGRQAGYAEGWNAAKAEILIAIVKSLTAL